MSGSKRFSEFATEGVDLHSAEFKLAGYEEATPNRNIQVPVTEFLSNKIEIVELSDAAAVTTIDVNNLLGVHIKTPALPTNLTFTNFPNDKTLYLIIENTSVGDTITGDEAWFISTGVLAYNPFGQTVNIGFSIPPGSLHSVLSVVAVTRFE